VLELPSTGWLRRYRVRAHGAVTQDKLDRLRKGVTVNGIHYGPIEAQLDRVQGTNLWLTLGIREGKNREVRNVLGELGLTVTRLIRVSFGPFQLGELADGAIEEVRTRTLREQLGARLVALSGADFSGTVAARPAQEARQESREQKNQKDQKNRGAVNHSWRAPTEGRAKPLRRKFHGSRRTEPAAREEPKGEMRPDTLTDRKGRRVAVERVGQPPPRDEPEATPIRRGRGRQRRRGSPDRAFGPRPSRPRLR
jgi:23S rRNA pseudouridine2605 synthase